MTEVSSHLLPPDSVTHYLTEFYAQNLPVCGYLGMNVQQYTGKRLSLSIDLKPSLNDKQTAFGGSLYNVCVMACWGMCYLQARQRGINPNIVVSQGAIDYRAPVDDDVIIAHCDTSDEFNWDDFFASFHKKGKAKVDLSSAIQCRDRDAVRFKGQYAIIGLNS